MVVFLLYPVDELQPEWCAGHTLLMALGFVEMSLTQMDDFAPTQPKPRMKNGGFKSEPTYF
jgi:hypothetical protein